MPEKYLEISKTKAAIRLVYTVLMLAAFSAGAIFLKRKVNPFISGLIWAIAGFFFTLSVANIKTILSNNGRLRLNCDGVAVQNGEVLHHLFYWSDVKAISVDDSTSIIRLIVNFFDNEFYISKLSIREQKIARKTLNKFGGPFGISPIFYQTDIERLSLDFHNKWHAAKDREV